MRKNVFIRRKKANLQNDYAPVVQSTKGIKGEILKKSLETTSGLQQDLRNPDALLDKKGKDLRLYDTMMLDGRIQSVVELKKILVLSVPNKIISASDDPVDVERADFAQQVLDDLKSPVWDDVLDNLLDSIIYGFKIGELIWSDKLINGKWVWEKFKFKHPLFFDFEYDEFGNLKQVLVGRNFGFDTKIDVETFNSKFIYMPYPYLKDGNYYGDSELKEIYAEWWQKYNITRWRGVYLQNFCMPVPKIIYDHNKTSATELNEIDAMFDNWQEMMRIKIPGVRDPKTGALIPKFEITFTDPGTKDGANQYNLTIDALDREISRKLLFPDKLGFTTDEAGSYSQSKKIFDIVLSNIKRIHARIEGVVYPKIQQLIDLNFPMGEEDEYPYLKFDEVDEKMEANLLQILLNAKVIDKREKWLRAYLGLPEITQEEKAEIEEAQAEDQKRQQEIFGQQQQQGQRQWGNTNNDRNSQPRSSGEDKSDTGKEKDQNKEEMKGEEGQWITVNGRHILVKTSDPNYRYHETSLQNIDLIRGQGLKPHIGVYGRGVYFSPTIGKGEASGEGIILRVSKKILSDKYEYGEFPDEGWAEKKIFPEDIDISFNKGVTWSPLIDKKSNMKSSDIPVNFTRIQKQFDTYENDFIRDYDSIMKEQTDYIIKQIEGKGIVENGGDLEAMKKLRISKTELKKLLSLYHAKLFLNGKVDAIEEVDRRLAKSSKLKRGEYVEFQIDNIEDEWLDRDWIDRYLREYGDLGILTAEDKQYLKDLRDRAFFITGQTEERILKEVYNAITNGLRAGTMAKTIIEQVRTSLDDDRQKYALTIARTNASDSYNTGRMNFFTSEQVVPYIEAYQYSAILDDKTTPFCREHDGQIIKKDDPDLARINPPNHYNCRSLLIPITIADADEEESYFYDYENQFNQWSGEPRPVKGFGG